MKKYRVLRDTHGFQGRMWTKDSIVSFADDVTPPYHFELLSDDTKVAEAKKEIATEQMSMSQMATKAAKPLPLAGNVLKDQKEVKPRIAPRRRAVKPAGEAF